MQGWLPKPVALQVKGVSSLPPLDVQRRITRHIEHLKGREAIRINHAAMLKRIGSYSKKKSGTSHFVAKQYQGIVEVLRTDTEGYWYCPVVSAFHTKTGRDHVLGSSLSQVPKQYWKSVLNPPQGSVYVLLDYKQQEPMIAAHFAGCQPLLSWYEQGEDIYQKLIQFTGVQLSREQCKQLLIGRLYGIGHHALAEKIGVSRRRVKVLLVELSKLIWPIDQYLDQSADAIRHRGIARSLDWQYAVSDLDQRLSLRNWKIQAAGADILRRACQRLDEANIPLLLTNHDSFLVRLEQEQFEDQRYKAVNALRCAAADVLDGFSLNVSIEMTQHAQEK
ncbi:MULTISPECIES: DNA polymerase [Vibrio]|uniref:DNA polymerase n=2 Tax=Vibrionaceae TaxID=641 RepID=UPI001F10AF4D|nr:DNA polymerase [Vibrio tasmaniensis]